MVWLHLGRAERSSCPIFGSIVVYTKYLDHILIPNENVTPRHNSRAPVQPVQSLACWCDTICVLAVYFCNGSVAAYICAWMCAVSQNEPHTVSPATITPHVHVRFICCAISADFREWWCDEASTVYIRKWSFDDHQFVMFLDRAFFSQPVFYSIRINTLNVWGTLMRWKICRDLERNGRKKHNLSSRSLKKKSQNCIIYSSIHPAWTIGIELYWLWAYDITNIHIFFWLLKIWLYMIQIYVYIHTHL